MIFRSLLWLIFLSAVIGIVMVITGCTSRIEYQPVPHWLIPSKPVVATVPAALLQCLNEETYTRLAERDRACWHYARELRALLGSESP